MYAMYAIARVGDEHDRVMVPRLAAASGADALRQFSDWLFENEGRDEQARRARMVDGRLLVSHSSGPAMYYAGSLEHAPSCGASGIGECDCLPHVREERYAPEPDGYRTALGRIIATSR